VALDGISLFIVSLTVRCRSPCWAASTTSRAERGFSAVAGADRHVGVFVAVDLFLFYVFG
jgi:NADH:ubiquinone oxidoreductase subunit 4 (subunit M)